MTTIKFDKSVKYQGVRYAAHEAFKVEDSDVDQLKKAGAIVLATESVDSDQTNFDDLEQGNADEGEHNDETGDAEDAAKLKEELLEYTVPELTEFAKERGIDLQGKTRKADIYNIIVASLN